MSLSLQAHFHLIPLSRIHHHRRHYQVFSNINSLNSSVSSLSQWRRHHALKKKNSFATLRLRVRCCGAGPVKANADDSGAASVGDSFHTDTEGSTEKDESQNRAPFSSKEILKNLKSYGVSGVLAYGLLNTAYYLTAFLVVCTSHYKYFSYIPISRSGIHLACFQVLRCSGSWKNEISLKFMCIVFLKLTAMVWAGSQVTKLARAGGALALAPFVDKGLSWFAVKFKFESKGKAFMAIVGLCFGLAAAVFFTLTLLWA